MGDSLVQILSQPLWVFLTVLARISPAIMLVPPGNSGGVPIRMRALLVIAIAVLLHPLASTSATQMPIDLPHLLIAVAGEVLLGVLLGSIVMLAIVSLQIAGQMVGNLGGMDIAVSLDPSSSEEMPVVSNLLGLLAMALLLILGGHRQLMQCALDSFAAYPAGGVVFSGHWLEEFQQVVQHAFVVGVRAAAPLGVALLLANITTGLLARTLPQLNVLSIGFNLNVSAMMMVLFISLGSVSWIFQNELAYWMDACRQIVTVAK